MTWLALSLSRGGNYVCLADSSSDSDSSSGEESDGSDGDEIVSQSQPIRRALTTRRVLASNASFNYGINIDSTVQWGDCDDAISEEGSVDSEEDEGGGHLIHDEEEEAYVITTKYGKETEEELHALKIPELKDRLRDLNKKLTAPRKQAYINRLLGREEETQVIIPNIEGDNFNEENLKKLKKYELEALCKQRWLNHSAPNKTILINRLLNREVGKQVDWEKSKARLFLVKLVYDDMNRIHNMTPEEIWDSWPPFQQYHFANFKQYLETTKKAAASEKAIAAINEEEIYMELLAYPRDEVTDRGYPYWDTHRARPLLEVDIRDGIADTMKPKELQDTRAEYKEFPLGVFRDHIYQERRRHRQEPGWQAKRNEQARKMHHDEVNTMVQDWSEKEFKDMCYVPTSFCMANLPTPPSTMCCKEQIAKDEAVVPLSPMMNQKRTRDTYIIRVSRR